MSSDLFDVLDKQGQPIIRLYIEERLGFHLGDRTLLHSEREHRLDKVEGQLTFDGLVMLKI